MTSDDANDEPPAVSWLSWTFDSSVPFVRFCPFLARLDPGDTGGLLHSSGDIILSGAATPAAAAAEEDDVSPLDGVSVADEPCCVTSLGVGLHVGERDWDWSLEGAGVGDAGERLEVSPDPSLLSLPGLLVLFLRNFSIFVSLRLVLFFR